MGAILKRSVVVSGKKTSISLEPEFWRELKILGQANGGIGNFVTGIKLATQLPNLSSALRIAILMHIKKLAAESADCATLSESESVTMRSDPLG